jgi:hypothetical protein
MVAIWLTATGFFGAAYFVSGGRRVKVEDGVTFTVAFGVAAAVSAVIALAVGAKRRWAFEAAVPTAILLIMPVGIAWILSLPALLMRWGIGPTPTAILEYARQAIPTGSILGVGTGAVVGVLMLLARRWPRLVLCFVAGLLLSCVIGSTHTIAFDRVVEFVVQTRQEGKNRFVANWTLGLELATAMGATAGAFVGAVVVYGAARLSDRSRAFRRHVITQ